MNSGNTSDTFECATWLEGLAAALPFLVVGALPSLLNLLSALGLNNSTPGSQRAFSQSFTGSA